MFTTQTKDDTAALTDLPTPVIEADVSESASKAFESITRHKEEQDQVNIGSSAEEVIFRNTHDDDMYARAIGIHFDRLITRRSRIFAVFTAKRPTNLKHPDVPTMLNRLGFNIKDGEAFPTERLVNTTTCEVLTFDQADLLARSGAPFHYEYLYSVK